MYHSQKSTEDSALPKCSEQPDFNNLLTLQANSTIEECDLAFGQNMKVVEALTPRPRSWDNWVDGLPAKDFDTVAPTLDALGQDLLSCLLCIDPALRLMAEQAGKGKATPIELASLVRDSSPYTPGYSPSQTQTEHQAEEVVPEAPVHDVGERSNIASKEDDGRPVDKSVLITFKDHIAYAIWNGELEGTRKLYTSSRWPKFKSWDLSKEVDAVQIRQAAVDAALSLVEGTIFGGQSQDMSAIVKEVYDILKVTRTGDYENSMPERR
ncbi:hypothetical protein LguiA_012908 [Lonicera macranthoides]